MVTTVALATRNQGKARELRALLDGPGRALLDLVVLGVEEELPETGDTFAANATQKAEQAMALTALPAIADDSGLRVEALGGAPGVYSARFGGPGLSDAERCRLLLDQLTGVPAERRGARFEAVLALARPGEPTVLARGALEGRITLEPRGENGFGYDPIFYLPALDATLASIPPAVKNDLSHRAAAARALRPILDAWLGGRPGGPDQEET